MKIFLRHTGFIVLVTMLSVLYIYNTHVAERKLRNINKMQDRVEDVKARYQAVKSDINFKCTESQLAKVLTEKGLQKNQQAPKLIRIEES